MAIKKNQNISITTNFVIGNIFMLICKIDDYRKIMTIMIKQWIRCYENGITYRNETTFKFIEKLC